MKLIVIYILKSKAVQLELIEAKSIYFALKTLSQTDSLSRWSDSKSSIIEIGFERSTESCKWMTPLRFCFRWKVPDWQNDKINDLLTICFRNILSHELVSIMWQSPCDTVGTSPTILMSKHEFQPLKIKWTLRILERIPSFFFVVFHGLRFCLETALLKS